jgi:hypothetical protein
MKPMVKLNMVIFLILSLLSLSLYKVNSKKINKNKSLFYKPKPVHDIICREFKNKESCLHNGKCNWDDLCRVKDCESKSREQCFTTSGCIWKHFGTDIGCLIE